MLYKYIVLGMHSEFVSWFCHDTPLGNGQQLCEVLSEFQDDRKEIWPGQEFWVCVHCDLEDTTLGQSQDTPLGHGQQLCETLSRLNKG